MLRRFFALLRRSLAVPPVSIKGFDLSIAIHRPRLIEYPRFITIGKNTLIRENSWISPIPSYAGVAFQPYLKIGAGVYIGRYCCITCIDQVFIGDGCVLSEHVYIADSSHGIDPDAGPIMAQPLTSKGPVKIGEGSFVGYGARIVSGVTLGRHCVVGANAVVTQSFDDYTMIAGLPARAIKRYDHVNKIWKNIE